MTDSSAPPETAPETTTEGVEYQATAITRDGVRAPVTEPRRTRESAEASARNCRDVGMTGLRVESRTVRTSMSPWRPVDESGDPSFPLRSPAREEATPDD